MMEEHSKYFYLMTENYEEYTDEQITEWNEEDAMPWVLGLSKEEIETLRNKKYELTTYGKAKLKQLLDKYKNEDT